MRRQLEDVALARSSIEEAMALWRSFNIGPVTKYRDLSEWMAWASAFLESSKGDAH